MNVDEVPELAIAIVAERSPAPASPDAWSVAEGIVSSLATGDRSDRHWAGGL